MRLSIVVAADESDTIGREGGLPWHLPDDLRRFKEITAGHVVIAGRRTQDSIVARLGRPLPGRTTVVVTRTGHRDDDEGGVLYARDVPSAIARAGLVAGGDEVFVIGGAQVYAEALPRVQRVYLTRVHDRVTGDVAMPEGWLAPFRLVDEEPRAGLTFQTYERA